MVRVLIAEDDPDLCWIWSETLADSGHAVTVAHDGETAQRLLESQPFDVLISDIVMPVSGAIVLAGVAKRLQPAIRVVAVTGSIALRDTALDDEVQGADRVLRKPIDLETLCAIVHRPAAAKAA